LGPPSTTTSETAAAPPAAPPSSSSVALHCSTAPVILATLGKRWGLCPADADEPGKPAGKATKKPGKAKAARPAPRRAVVKLVLPKNEKSLIPLIQRVLGGKVKKSSPCRIVFEKSSLMSFMDSVGHLVRVKRAELASVA
jgi:hypothetical protein